MNRHQFKRYSRVWIPTIISFMGWVLTIGYIEYVKVDSYTNGYKNAVRDFTTVLIEAVSTHSDTVIRITDKEDEQ